MCDTCNGADTSKPWNCPICGEETCENCMTGFSICGVCGEGVESDKDLYRMAEKVMDTEYYFGTFEEFFGD
jgi:hypothetical protein